MITTMNRIGIPMTIAMPRVLFARHSDSCGTGAGVNVSLRSQAEGIKSLLPHNTEGLIRLATLPRASVLKMIDQYLVSAKQIAVGANNLVRWADFICWKRDHGQYAHYSVYKGYAPAGYSQADLREARAVDIQKEILLLKQVADVLEARPRALADVIKNSEAAVAYHMIKSCVFDHIPLKALCDRLRSSAESQRFYDSRNVGVLNRPYDFPYKLGTYDLCELVKKAGRKDLLPEAKRLWGPVQEKLSEPVVDTTLCYDSDGFIEIDPESGEAYRDYL